MRTSDEKIGDRVKMNKIFLIIMIAAYIFLPVATAGSSNGFTNSCGLTYALGSRTSFDGVPEGYVYWDADLSRKGASVDVYNDSAYLYINVTLFPEAKPYIAWGENDHDGDGVVGFNDIRSDGINFTVAGTVYAKYYHSALQSPNVTIPLDVYASPAVYYAQISLNTMPNPVPICIFFHASPNAMSGVPEAPEGLELWLWNDGAVYQGTSSDEWLNMSFVKEILPAVQYNFSVNVLDHNTKTDAKKVILTVWISDNSTISNVEVGQARRYTSGNKQGSAKKTFTSADFKPGMHLGKPGFYINYDNIGTVPKVKNFSFGDPLLGTWDPSKVSDYVKVPVNITLTAPPVPGFMINFEAGNKLKSRRAVTSLAHDDTKVVIPEFPTIVLPIAAVLAVMLMMQKRKGEMNHGNS